MNRTESRVERIVLALDRLDRLMKADPDGPKTGAWTARWNEYVGSLNNLKKFGQERAPSGRPAGVEIDVPSAYLRVRSLTPGG